MQSYYSIIISQSRNLLQDVDHLGQPDLPFQGDRGMVAHGLRRRAAAVASSATETKAPPIPTALAPDPTGLGDDAMPTL